MFRKSKNVTKKETQNIIRMMCVRTEKLWVPCKCFVLAVACFQRSSTLHTVFFRWTNLIEWHFVYYITQNFRTQTKEKNNFKFVVRHPCGMHVLRIWKDVNRRRKNASEKWNCSGFVVRFFGITNRKQSGKYSLLHKHTSHIRTAAISQWNSGP